MRGQYEKGIVEGTEAPGYREEEGVARGSCTETFAALRVSLDSWRWAGVPFLLRTGKRLSRRTTEISTPLQAAAASPVRRPGAAATPPNV